MGKFFFLKKKFKGKLIAGVIKVYFTLGVQRDGEKHPCCVSAYTTFGLVEFCQFTCLSPALKANTRESFILFFIICCIGYKGLCISFSVCASLTRKLSFKHWLRAT